jgi:hypothetical protein
MFQESTYCSHIPGFLLILEKPASLRLQDVMSIWVLLSRFLAGSKAHDTITDTVLFHRIISVLARDNY